jgi:small nuclear ribonucleoprotein (snRNP)-like protein
MILSRLFRFTAMFLAVVLLSTSLAFAKKPADPAVMKAKIQARGVGQGVRVTLSDQTEVKGVIVAVHDQTFVVKAKKAPEPQEIDYAKVIGVHNDKLTRGEKVGIVAGAVAVGVVVVAVVLTVKLSHFNF